MKKLALVLSLCCLFLCLNTKAQDSLRFISGTTGAACQVIKYHDGYLYTGTGSTFRIYNAGSPQPYQMVFEYRYQSAIIDMLIRDDNLYLSANYDGMTKWDISSPSNPFKVFEILSDDGLPMLNVKVSGDTIFLARLKKMTAYRDLSDHFQKIGDFGQITGNGKIYGTAIKNGICAFTVADAISSDNGVHFYRTSDFSFISHFIQTFCWPENVIWGKNNDILHVLGGTNGVNGHFYSLDISEITQPQMVYSDTVIGVPFGLAVANPVKAVNINDTIYVATTAGMKPNGPLDTTFIYVYDATNPANIRFINYLPAGLWHFDLDINYPYYYVASEWYGVKTVNFSNFFHPVDLGNTLTGGWNTGSDKFGNRLVVANEGYGFKIFDISDIHQPVFTGSNNDPGFCIKARFSEDGNYIYTANMTYEGFRIYNADSLTKTGAIQQFVGAGKFQVNHDRIYSAQEIFGNFLNIIDVSNPSSPFIEKKIAKTVNDMCISDNKLFIANNDSILIFDILDNHFDLVADIALGTFEDAKVISVYNNIIYVYIAPKGLVKYQLTNNGTAYSITETGTYTLPNGEPAFMAADTFGLYLAYQVNGLYACDRQSLVQKGYFRGELDLKAYPNQYGIQDLYCKDNLVFLVEYFSQTSILTNDNHFPFGITNRAFEEPCYLGVYPNPFSGRATLKISTRQKPDDWNLFIYDLNGRRSGMIKNIESDLVPINGSNLEAGMYVLKLVGRNKNIGTGKFIIKK